MLPNWCRAARNDTAGIGLEQHGQAMPRVGLLHGNIALLSAALH